MTWPVVRSSFIPWNAQFEGRIPWMYLDAKGKVTTGIGWLIDSLADAIALPWQQPDGSRASAADITAAWTKVHAAQQLKGIGGAQPAFRDLTGLRLPDDAIDVLTLARFDANDALLRSFFPGFDGFPADAQRVIHSMAWAMGADRFRDFPKFVQASNALDFATAAAESHMSETGNAPLAPRNVADAEGLLRASQVVLHGLPRDAFFDGETPSPQNAPSRRGLGTLLLLALIGGATWYATRSP
jgi:hypothetical protein